LEKQDGADLGRITLDPTSLKVAKDDSVHPGGVACRVQAWKPGYSTSPKPEFELTLGEFPDPNGKAACFRLRDLSAAVDDELLASKR